MTTANALDTYLAEVRRRLSGLPASEAEETVRELRSHVLDATGGDLSADKLTPALAALGPAADIARLNAAARLASDAAVSRSPWRVLRATIRIARLGAGGAWALLLSVIGYAFAAALIVTAIAKPFAPSRAGLWRMREAADTYTFSLGFMDHPPSGAELLGWWIIPIGLALGAAVAYATFRYDRWSLRRLGRHRLPAQGPQRIDPDMSWA